MNLHAEKGSKQKFDRLLCDYYMAIIVEDVLALHDPKRGAIADVSVDTLSQAARKLKETMQSMHDMTLEMLKFFTTWAVDWALPRFCLFWPAAYLFVCLRVCW